MNTICDRHFIVNELKIIVKIVCYIAVFFINLLYTLLLLQFR